MAGAVGGVASGITDGLSTGIATWFTPRQRQEVSIRGGTRHDIRGGGEPRVKDIRGDASSIHFAVTLSEPQVTVVPAQPSVAPSERVWRV